MKYQKYIMLSIFLQRELIDLCRLTTLNGQRARLLFNTGGMQSVAEVANARPEDIEILLQNAAPFESGKVIQQGESEHDVKERKALRSFWVTGKKGLTEAEAAILIVEEARELLEKDLGIKIHDWNENNIETNPAIEGIKIPTFCCIYVSIPKILYSKKILSYPYIFSINTVVIII